MSYIYDTWGKVLSVTDENGNEITDANNIGLLNPIRYRGYYYDAETGYYYLQSRYYNPDMGRFISVDNQLSLGSDLTGTNMFSYCGNNPVNRIDPTGHYATAAIIGIPIGKSLAPNKVSKFDPFKYESNKLPNIGEPNSNRTLKKPDGTTKQKRWYGPDGKPVRDRDYNHPGDVEFPHDHEWKNGKRGKDHLPPSSAYTINWDAVAGSALIASGIIGTAIFVADDATVVGFLNNGVIAFFISLIEQGTKIIME